MNLCLTENDKKDKRNNSDSDLDVYDVKVIDNHIYFYSEIDRESVLDLIHKLKELVSKQILQSHTHNLDRPIPIYLHINSYGGYIGDGLTVMDKILYIKKHVYVITVVDGYCASAGTFLSFVGTKRTMNKHARILIHELSGWAVGKFTMLEDSYENAVKEMNTIKNIYKTYTKLPIKRIEELLKHDTWFESDDCLKFGFVDEVIE